jgi:urease accessory protein UreE
MSIELIESTGYSYSGVTDLVRNSQDNEVAAYALLVEIDGEYNSAKQKVEELEKMLVAAKANRGHMVSMFLHVHKVMELSGDLVFQQKDDIVKIKIIDENTIDYSRIELTDFSKLNK